jgi:hypothetical protein
MAEPWDRVDVKGKLPEILNLSDRRLNGHPGHEIPLTAYPVDHGSLFADPLRSRPIPGHVLAAIPF